MIVSPGPYGKRGPGGKPPQRSAPVQHMTPLLANRLWLQSYGRRVRRSTWS